MKNHHRDLLDIFEDASDDEVESAMMIVSSDLSPKTMLKMFEGLQTFQSYQSSRVK